MRIDEAWGGRPARRLTRGMRRGMLGVRKRRFRRCIDRYRDAGFDGLVDKCLGEVSARRGGRGPSIAGPTATGVCEGVGMDAKDRNDTRDQAIAPRRGDGPLNVRTSHRTGANPGGRMDSTEDNVDALDTALPTLSRLSPTNFQGPATGDSGERSDNPCAKRPYGSLCCQHPVFSVGAEVEMALR